MDNKPKPPRIVTRPVSPTGEQLQWCSQSERHAWIRQLVPDLTDFGTNALMARPEWFKGFKIDDLDGFTPQSGGTQNFRLNYRDGGGHLWCVIERCSTYAEVVERGFIIACVTRSSLKRK